MYWFAQGNDGKEYGNQINLDEADMPEMHHVFSLVFFNAQESMKAIREKGVEFTSLHIEAGDLNEARGITPEGT